MDLSTKTKEQLIEELHKLQAEHKSLKDFCEANLTGLNQKLNTSYDGLLQRIIDLLPIRIFWKDKDLNYLGCNAVFAKDAGKINPDEMIGKNDFQMNWAEQAELYRADDFEVIKTGNEKRNYEEPQTTPDGNVIWLKTSKVLLTDVHGVLMGVLGTYEDITEYKEIQTLKEKNTELRIAKEKAEKAASLGTVIAGVSHELNNPFNFIVGGVNELNKELKDLDETKQKNFKRYLDIINEGVRRASLIMKGLSYYKQDNNPLKEECNVHELIDACLKGLSDRLGNRIGVEKQYSQEPIILIGNREKLQEAFMHILSNAEHAILRNGMIKISTQFKNNQKIIIFEDNGEGINPENLSKIGDPFFTTKIQGQGTGLGLWITYGIIRNYGGKVSVTSEVDKGTQ